MKIKAKKADHINLPDYIEVWVARLHVQMAFYPLESWAWEWSMDTRLLGFIRFEFPSFSLYIAKRY